MKTMEVPISSEEYQLMLENVQAGWWKADFSGNYYLCSDYIIKLLGLTDA